MSMALIELGVASALLGAVALGLEVGFRLGRRAARDKAKPEGIEVGAVQGAALGMLGLLLGFSFAGASGRFVDRQDLIVREANAVGSAGAVFALADAALAGEARAVLDRYVRARLEQGRSIRAGEIDDPALDRELRGAVDALWGLAGRAAERTPALAVPVINAVTAIDDVHDARDAARRRHLPGPVMGLLVACAALAVATIGFGSGLGGRRNLVMTAPLVLLIVATLWTTIDLDFPRAGMIRVDDAALGRLAGDGLPRVSTGPGRPPR